MTLISKHLSSLILAIVTYCGMHGALHWLFADDLANWMHPAPYLFQVIWWYAFYLSAFLIRWNRFWHGIPLSRMPSVWGLIGWVSAILFFSAFFVWSGRYFHMDLPFEWPMILNYHGPSFFMLCFLILIVSPIVQELLFRGWLWGHLAGSAIGPVGALAITTYLWAIPSATAQLHSGVFNLLMGLLLGIARIWTQGVMTPILMHIAFCFLELFLVSQFMWQS